MTIFSPGLILPPRPEFIVIPPSIINHTDGTAVTSGGASFTFSHTVSAGTSKLVVGATGASGSVTTLSVSGITFNAVSMTQVTQFTNVYAGSNSSVNALYYMDNPTVTTANIVVTFSTTAGTKSGACAYNLQNTAAGAGNTSNTGGNTSTLSLGVNLTTTVANVVLIAEGSINDNVAQSAAWTNITEDREASPAGGKLITNASGTETTIVSGKTYTLTAGSTPTELSMAIAAFN